MYSQISWAVLKTLKESFLNQTNRMDCNRQEIISRLKFIGTIKKGDKVNTRHMFIQPSGLATSFSRTFMNQDSRSNSINFCIETIKRSFELLTTYERSNNKSENQLYINVLEDLKRSIIGIENLKSTYIDDNKFCCDMETLLQEIRARLDTEFDKLETNNDVK
tara:strand:- start:7278 stop:7766 length:489 start_codon:yes stop_codon:yes gene_type:complete